MAYSQTRSRTQESAEDAISALTERFDQFVEQFGDTAQTTGKAVSERFDSGRQQVEDAAERGYRDVRRQTQRGVENVSGQIEKNPLSSVVVAFAAGILIGKLL
ncbi:hypothetical protein N825_26125 [Skermanella stibiiresistens SB22]|uniref:DUF883 domain-containing protein n=1 Tax=Skermanella stibiiresistens SB22 TaxID=1385369 RepID=W9GR22_9PROT|nr:DUF883 family protein [Skermanella stibiiresistens]EWY36350.1 hypothetical protein N825_26125 [Skermanella stibiiresistens SB22]